MEQQIKTMHEIIYGLTQLINIVLFTGYAVYTLTWIVVSLIFKNNRFVKELDEAANRLVPFLGILFFVLWMAGLVLFYTTESAENIVGFNNRAFGKYWWGYWLQPTLYVVATQLLWFSKFRHQEALRFLIAFVLFFSFEKFVILTTSLHRDYFPSSWEDESPANYFLWNLLDRFATALIFVVLALLYYFAVKFLKRDGAKI